MSVEILWVDANSDFLPSYVESDAVLANGVPYQLEVHGNFSWWINDDVPFGTVETVIYQSPSASGEFLASMDAETIYADILDRPLPRHQDVGSRFLINLGSGFAHPHPDTGMTSTPSPDHRYIYTVVGEGEPLQAAMDGPIGARNGQLRIQLSPLSGLTVGPLQLA